MNRFATISLLALIIGLPLAGCYDSEPSRDPKTVAEVERLSNRVNQMEQRFDNINEQLTALGRIEAELHNFRDNRNSQDENANWSGPRGNGNIYIYNYGGGSSRVSDQPLQAGPLAPVEENGERNNQRANTPPPEVSNGGASTGTGTGTGTEGSNGGNSTPPPAAGANESGSTTSVSRGAETDDRTANIIRLGYDRWNERNPRQANEQPRSGGRIRVQLSAQPEKLNHYLDNSAVTGYILDGQVYEALIEQDPDTFEFLPSLAESWVAEDMLYKIVGSKPIANVEFDASMQKWVLKQEDEVIQTWWPWEVREKTEGGHEQLELDEFEGIATKTATGWDLLTGTAGGAFEETLHFVEADVANVNKGTVFTFKLRRGVKFHDGVEMTADDVLFTVGFIKCPEVDAPSIRSYYENVRMPEKIDDYTVKVIYDVQYFQALEFAGGFMIHPKHVYDPNNLLNTNPTKFGEEFNNNPRHTKAPGPVGTGPYKFENWNEGTSVTVKKFPDYWRPEKGGYLDEITWKFIPNPATALAELRAGGVDFVPSMSADQFFVETHTDEFKQRFAKPVFFIGNFGYVGWNMRKPPFDDVRVRTAMTYGAVDIPEFIKQVNHGAAIQVTGSQYILGPAYNKDVETLPFDQNKARQLLLEAGWFDRDGDGIIENADGVPFTFNMALPQGSTAGQRMGAIMKENLEKLGIRMEVVISEWSVFLENIHERNFDSCRLGWVQGLESDPFQLWHTSCSENRGSNHCGFGNDETDALILKIRGTLDDEERYELQRQFQAILYREQPYTFLYCSPELGAYDPKFHGVKFIPFRPGYDLKEWYIAE
ncbi:MAG: ABC transporter substrate-binding protein [Planctomycetes bacterium]|nr:ABC transporter substrate-binding protein [Planctomycetota bacterium]